MTYLGNILLLDQLLRPSSGQGVHGFICSRCTRSSAILPCLDWAVAHNYETTPIMSTFHSEMEKAVLDMLIGGKCPVIIVLGRSLYKVIPEKLKPLLSSNRLLIISLCEQKRISRESAYECNKFICEHSTDLTFGYISHGSSLNMLRDMAAQSDKSIKVITED